ncbi:hypothetical protein GCK72_024254 [Caenorhabditis remanei]|uniref:Uncharacterized protein n=1 Tax=Caenorhabditis remanei TaxID=31234 RepID=E3LEH9_CAERE|nr:hypothetical protein GCK72_024254 [Caenorhabditis remanei]EFO82379.1 hypothetical protein CRE_00319 [Caenorhabditis remanei]KAF1747788.1 hypothetical protein GCK72_024254 [Caenorhabditis remanei]
MAVCSLFRDDDSFRRFFAIFSWLLKIITLIVFFASVRLHDQYLALHVEQREAREENGPVSNYPRRPRRVAYRPLSAPTE